MQTILIVDDDDDIREIIEYSLKKEGFKVLTAENGEEGISLAKLNSPDLIILDVMMPGMDGIEVCETLKSQPETSNIKICFLTARGEDYSQIAGFNAGADDYVNKPVKPKVLVSRIKAILRRGQLTSKTEIKPEDKSIFINRDKYIVTVKGEVLNLPKKEFELLALLASKPGKVFNRDVIMEAVWGTETIVGDRTIDVHIRKLREKIGDNFIQTVKGVGYKFIENP